MVKITWSKLEKNHHIFTQRFETYTPKSLRHIQGETKKSKKKNEIIINDKELHKIKRVNSRKNLG